MRPLVDYYAAPIQSIIADPYPSSSRTRWAITNRGTGGAGATSYDATNQAFVETTSTAPSTVTYTFRINSGQSQRFPVTPGWYLAQSIWVNSSIADARAFTIDFFDSSGVSTTHDASEPASAYSTRVSLAANTWTQLTYRTIVPAGAAFVEICVVWTGTSGPAASIRTAGSTLMLRRATVLYSPAPIPTDLEKTFVAGDIPGWQYVGAVGAVTRYSIGYPYTLNAITGPPWSINTTPNSFVSGPTVGSTQGRALAYVYDSLLNGSTPTAQAYIASMRGTSGTNSGEVFARFNTGNTNIDGGMRPLSAVSPTFRTSATGGQTFGRHVGIIQADEGLGTLRHLVDDTTELVTTSITDLGSGLITTAGVSLNAATSEVSPVAAYALPATTNLQTRKRTQAWLARRYNSIVPTGY